MILVMTWGELVSKCGKPEEIPGENSQFCKEMCFLIPTWPSANESGQKSPYGLRFRLLSVYSYIDEVQ